ncbi:GNAT family N-acetyltransferase [Streptomyces cavernae]|uniref:GNAT family N-acetyltransferase n=1 Tax=Streptomyces cavernae TaxID=2259034 RepID=UPI000FEBEE41|nr:GNAT family N-acetyltransferase [Streptomyces cavernae]
MDTEPTWAFPEQLRLEGDGIRLREWADDDVPALVELYDDPEIDRWTPIVSPFDTAAARTYLHEARVARAEGRKVQLAITTDGLRPRGEVLLFRSDVDPRDAEIGYGVAAPFRGRGLATRAVRLLADYAVRRLRPRRLVLCIEEANVPSAGVARASGFELAQDAPVIRTSKGRRLVLRTWQYGCWPGGSRESGRRAETPGRRTGR